MAKQFAGIIGLIITLWCSLSFAEPAQPIKSTHRVHMFSNKKVDVWRTIIYPSQAEKLTMHRHEHDHKVIALTDGLLKITNNKGETHLLKLKRGHAYLLRRDLPGEYHTDKNITNHPIHVVVIELRGNKKIA